MPVDTSKYLGLFVAEASEHLSGLSSDLVRLEKGAGPEAIDSLFRHAHSVKGMAASMGFEPIAALAHRAEDLADKVRGRPELMNAELADLLLSATDRLQEMVQAV